MQLVLLSESIRNRFKNTRSYIRQKIEKNVLENTLSASEVARIECNKMPVNPTCCHKFRKNALQSLDLGYKTALIGFKKKYRNG